MISTWEDLQFWKSPEWAIIQERLNDLEAVNAVYNPRRENLFAALDAVPFDKVQVMIMGQDPYPDYDLATGIAFNIPKEVIPQEFPPTLNMIFREYNNDLHYPTPSTGDLSKWCEQGVLLWNAIPTCLTNISMSHEGWEWNLLTSEIISELNEKVVVFAFLGRVAREYNQLVNNSTLIETSHPSPRGSINSKVPFLGSRLFSTINTHLCSQGEKPIDWRL